VRYRLACLADLHAMLKAHGDWMPLGNADEQKPAADGTVLEALGQAEVEHQPRNNRMRAI
jgi:hypothetical protein